jgi:hypothetical protein
VTGSVVQKDSSDGSDSDDMTITRDQCLATAVPDDIVPGSERDIDEESHSDDNPLGRACFMRNSSLPNRFTLHLTKALAVLSTFVIMAPLWHHGTIASRSSKIIKKETLEITNN